MGGLGRHSRRFDFSFQFWGLLLGCGTRALPARCTRQEEELLVALATMQGPCKKKQH